VTCAINPVSMAHQWRKPEVRHYTGAPTEKAIAQWCALFALFHRRANGAWRRQVPMRKQRPSAGGRWFSHRDLTTLMEAVHEEIVTTAGPDQASQRAESKRSAESKRTFTLKQGRKMRMEMLRLRQRLAKAEQEHPQATDEVITKKRSNQ
jgi:hypothetical protein